MGNDAVNAALSACVGDWGDKSSATRLAIATKLHSGRASPCKWLALVSSIISTHDLCLFAVTFVPASMVWQPKWVCNVAMDFPNTAHASSCPHCTVWTFPQHSSWDETTTKPGFLYARWSRNECGAWSHPASRRPIECSSSKSTLNGYHTPNCTKRRSCRSADSFTRDRWLGVRAESRSDC